jgi:hypothetical protein
MFILNRYNVSTPVGAATAGAAVVNINPNVITGATGDSGAASGVTTITATATYTDQTISKLVAITIPTTLTAGQDNYIVVDLVKLGIPGIRPVLAALLLGVYDPASTEQTAAGATPSFIGIWDKTATNINSVSVVNSKLNLKIPAAQIALFQNKTAMVQLFYSTNNNE